MKRKALLSKFAAAVGAAAVVGEAEARGMDVQISIPDADGIGLNGIVPITVEVHPTANLRHVQVLIDGALQVQNATSPFVYNWDTKLVADGTHVIQALAQYKTRKSVAQIAVTVNNVAPPPPPPPPVGNLRWRPPGWNGTGDVRNPASFPGYAVIDLPPIVNGQPQTLNLDNTKDYYIRPGKLEWSSLPSAGGQVRSGFRINGGRNVVLIGSEILFNSTNPYDDCAGIQVIGGDPNGTVYLEGLRIQSVNCITWSSPRNRITQHVHWKARIFEDKADTVHGGIGNHPDGEQIWQDGANEAEIFEDRVTGYTWYTGMTCLIQQPTRWQRHRVDLHFGQRAFQTQQMGNFMLYLSPGNQAVTCKYDGGDTNWMDLGWWGGCREQLQQAIDSPGWTTKLGYEIRRGTQTWPSSDPNAFRCQDIGATQGDQWRCTSNANITEKWNWGKPPDGEFAPWDKCGVGYIPAGYA